MAFGPPDRGPNQFPSRSGQCGNGLGVGDGQVGDPVVAEESDVEPDGRLRHGEADGQRGHRAARMADQDVRGLMLALHGCYLLGGPEHRQEQGHHVRAVAPQAAAGAPPCRFRVRAAVAENGGQHGAMGAVPAASGCRIAEHLVHDWDKAAGEEDH